MISTYVTCTVYLFTHHVQAFLYLSPSDYVIGLATRTRRPNSNVTRIHHSRWDRGFNDLLITNYFIKWEHAVCYIVAAESILAHGEQNLIIIDVKFSGTAD